MTTLTLTKAPVLPELDRPDAVEIGDEILLESAANAKVDRVSGGRGSARQSAEARAWTSAGQVD
jgi:hypothetical protein